MKCKDCKTKYKCMTGGMGNPEEPRAYLYLSLVCCVMVGLGILGMTYAWDYTGCISYILFAFGAVGVPISFFYSFSARNAAAELNDGYKHGCPKCGKMNKVYIWSN